MEGFSYVDLFATKGIEYLLVIGFLLAFIYYWRILDKPLKSKIATTATALKPAGTMVEWFNLAKNVYYHPGHSWAMPEDNNVVLVGMDDFTYKLLGKPDSLEVPQVGSQIEQGENGWRIKFDSKSINILSPVNGEVIAVNKKAISSPELIGQDPYKTGWLLKVKVPKMSTNMKNLLTGKLAVAWMENTVQSLRERMVGNLGLVMQDGGLPVTGFAKELEPDNWDELAAEFLLTKS